MKYIIRADYSWESWITSVAMLFITPAIAMLAWGAFVEITDLSLPKFGYWAFFMLNLVVSIFKTHIPTKWRIGEKE